MNIQKSLTKSYKKTKFVLFGAMLSLVALPASADNAGEVATRVFEQFSAFANVIMGAIFLAGLAIAGAAAFKFKEHSQNAQQVPLKIPMFYAIVAAICIGLPAFLIMGRTSLFGDADGNTLEEGAYHRITN